MFAANCSLLSRGNFLNEITCRTSKSIFPYPLLDLDLMTKPHTFSNNKNKMFEGDMRRFFTDAMFLKYIVDDAVGL